MSPNDIEVQALGRPAYLGQLYNATTSTLINECLFDPAKMKVSDPQKTSNLIHSYKEAKSLEDRRRTLDISASISISFLGGLVDIGGYGSYFDRTDSSGSSHTISTTTRVRTVTEKLDVESHKDAVRLSLEQVTAVGATHVVTAIIYGGNAVGCFTQRESKSDFKRNVHGRLDASILEGIGFLISAKGHAEMTVKQREIIESFHVEIQLHADFNVDSVLPTNAPDMFTTVVKSHLLIGDRGIPCDLYLTSLGRFKEQFQKISLIREIDDTQRDKILIFYNNLITLDLDRTQLCLEMEHFSSYFPSFMSRCRKGASKVNQDLLTARQDLRKYLLSYRRATLDNAPDASFLDNADHEYRKELGSYEDDLKVYNGLLKRKRSASDYDFSLVDVSALRRVMNRTDNATISLVVVPETVLTVNLLNMYGVLADDIRQWKAFEAAKRGENNETLCFSLHADPLIDDSLRLLDDSDGSLVSGVKRARDTSEPQFLTYGIGVNKFGELGWSSMNRDGWGIEVSMKEKWRYIGEFQKGERHGSGVITYADGSRYIGDWVLGHRDGRGRKIEKGVAGEEQVYIDDRVRSDGVVVEVTVFKDSVPVKFTSVALGGHDALSSHTAKLAKVFDWGLGQRHKIMLESIGNHFKPTMVVTNGWFLDPSMEPGTSSSFWPLNAEGQKIIKVTVIP